MKMLNKILAGTAAAAALTVTVAAPAQAQAQYYDRYYQRDRGIDVGDIAAGVAIIGGIAAITSALTRDQGYYGHGYNNRYAYDYRGAVQSCGYQAQRYGRANVTNVSRTGANRYRVDGFIDGYDRRGFTCTARANGRVTNFRLAGGYW